MGSFFDLDGPLVRFGNMLADFIILSLLWFFLSLPIFTIGAATTAIFYVATRRISNKEGYIFRDFFKSFKDNFVQATLTWLIILILGLGIYINIVNIDLFGDNKIYVLPLQYGILFELVLLTIYVFPLIARFHMKFFQTIKTAFFMANKHIFNSLALVIMAVAILVIAMMYTFLIIFVMGIYSFCASYFIMRVFKKYRPEIDAEDIHIEE